MNFVSDDNFDPAVIGSAFWTLIVGNRASFANSMRLDEIGLVSSLGQVAAHSIRTPLGEIGQIALGAKLAEQPAK